MKIIFFNISYMDFYKGKQNDKLIGNFRYVQVTNDGGEKHNFQPFIIDGKEVCRGFVEPGFTKGGYENGRQRQIHIEKINGTGNQQYKIDNVLVVWCAKLPETSRSVIVGWYKNATVFKNVISLPYNKETDVGLPDFGYWYNVIADKDDCVLLPTEERKELRWTAYRRNQKQSEFGFGQSNMWYAKEENAQKYVAKIILQIEQYNGENWV